MKLGSIDGSVEEVRDLLENHGLNLEDFLEKPPTPLKTIFLILPAVVLGVVLFLFALLSNQCSPTTNIIFYLVGFGSGTWLTVSIQLRFNNSIATFSVAIGVLVLILVASGIFSPEDAAKFISQTRK